MTQEIDVSSLTWDSTFYPRQNISESHISRLADALRAGETFPAVVVDSKSLRIVDGTHRWKAWRRVHGDDSKIPCDLREYESESQMYLAAIDLNTAHGLDLTNFERTRCLLRLRELGIERETCLRALRMTSERAEKMLDHKTAIRVFSDGKQETVALKGSMSSFRGQVLSEKQVEVNRMAGGMKARYYVDLVIGLVESGVADSADAELLKRFMHLRELLKALPKRKIA